MIRPANEADFDAIQRVVAAAFDRSDEAELVTRLRKDGDVLTELVAVEDGQVIGHVMFSRLELVGTFETLPAAALAPLAIAPGRQRQGHGAALSRAGLEACRDQGLAAAVVLGHPDYYPRFGFTAAASAKLQAPFSGPSFMAVEFQSEALAEPRRARYAAAFGLDDPITS